MVGIGTQDDLDFARDFKADTGVESYPLLWSESSESWAAFGVTSQPYLVLLRDGQILERWPGGASTTEIEAAIDRTA